jgi:predicted HTH domain antitoxin
MAQITVSLPEGLPEALHMSSEEVCKETKLILAAKLYEQGRVSAGYAAEIAGMDRLTLLAALERYGVPAINLTGDEVNREIEAARRISERC